jgi:hypothetical protein
MKGRKTGGRQRGTPNKTTPLAADVKALAGVYTTRAIQILAGILENDALPPAVRIMAAKELLDRGCGKPVQALSGPEGGAPIPITIVHQELKAD